jgi:hypothetical protein
MRSALGHLAIGFLVLAGLSSMVSFPACRAADVPLAPYTIDSNFDGPGSVYACDVDGDGSTDVLGAATNTSQLAWWDNGGGTPVTWTKYLIADAFGTAIFVYAEDVDGDLDMDVLGAGWGRNQIAWWRNDGGNPIVWTKQAIASGFTNAHEVYACDVDRDGDVDVIGAGAGNNTIAWWRNDGGNPIVWTAQTIGTGFNGARSVHAADLDGDGDIDVVGAALLSNEIAWWRNDGGNPIVWTKFVISNTFAGAHMVRTCDVDLDGDMDLLGAAYSGGELAWWRNDGGSPIVWTKFTIASGFTGAVTIGPADLDDDGDVDILGAAQAAGDIAWWSNEGGDPIVWQMHMIDANFTGVWPACAADLDGDTYTDIVAGGGLEIRWWQNGLAVSGVGGHNGRGSAPASPFEPLRLYQNSPNPFNPTTAICFELARAGYARLSIYDIAGRLVRTLVDGSTQAGSHSVAWDGRDEKGREMPSGLYFYRMTAGTAIETRPMTLLR